ncbi:MAG: DEAD/DEAH box helicase [Zoogloeaceae bacterium]|jgi:superfamily II DNA or RNA helicase|nr:DEAD/DEAH box helicase [Zoogloeaceae bacterium]
MPKRASRRVSPPPLLEDPPTSPGVRAWIADLRHFSAAVSKKQTGAARQGQRAQKIFYCLDQVETRDGLPRARITLLKGADLDSARAWSFTPRALIPPPRFLREEDLRILSRLSSFPAAPSGAAGSRHGRGAILLESPLSEGAATAVLPSDLGELLEKILATGRMAAGCPFMTLSEGTPRSGKVSRLSSANLPGHTLETRPPSTFVLPLSPPWYLDLQKGCLGRVECAENLEVWAKSLRLPFLPPLPDLPAFLSKNSRGGARTARTESLAEIDAPPTGVLSLASLPAQMVGAWRGYRQDLTLAGGAFDYAQPLFCYRDFVFAVEDPRRQFLLPEGGRLTIRRRPEEEKRLLRALTAAGLQPLPPAVLRCERRPSGTLYGLFCEADWADFLAERRALLEKAGWRIRADGFRRHYRVAQNWDAALTEESDGALALEMSVTIEGERLPLAPLLARLLREEPRWLDAIALTEIPDGEMVRLATEDGRFLRVEAARVKPIALFLLDLFDRYRDGETRLKLSRHDAARLSFLRESARWRFHGETAALEIARRLAREGGVREVAPPRGLRLELRDYQRQGLSWLQYLREHALAGILADDMGLGKTAQTLAHLLVEKEAGRLDLPSLVVLPTSLLSTWESEARRFAPDLKVLRLHGQARQRAFGRIPEADVALTTYPLLWRDSARLSAYRYHFLILDEAQNVKNARSKSAGVVRRLNARHRLCLTGTPLENHLGELWAQFDFLLPGFLGDQKSFARLWRLPIEKQGDLLRRDLLARRVRPFILRRKKDDVAQELPPKTEILRTVELQGGQRDLYETVRAALDKRVRAEIALYGFDKSRVVILDALLKLRQVCCDPRLVKSALARRAAESAKLALLMDMLPEMVEEGRKILVFSQFTAMLALIRRELDALRLPYTILTGETRNRDAAIASFQKEGIPVFLISLKAGGVGLNLTAADTVIHYDPWWNPAAENQATDRAHRIGQDKPVFVYKLIAAGSIEERILSLQTRKAALTEGILSERHAHAARFTPADLAALLEPLPNTTG